MSKIAWAKGRKIGRSMLRPYSNKRVWAISRPRPYDDVGKHGRGSVLKENWVE